MSGNWQRVRLEDVTTIIGDGLHGTPEYDEFGEYHFINGNNLQNGKIVITESTKKSSEHEYLRHKKNLNNRTILVSINGTLGNVAIYEGEKVFLGKSACYLNVDENVDKYFVRYVISSNIFQDYIHSLATGSTIKNVSLKLMRNFEFYLPSLNEQQKISGILKSLDDKITLNRQINQTLEAMAQALFKSWFVDFEPVKAKLSALAVGGSANDANLAAMSAISGKTIEQLLTLKTTNPDQYQQLYTTADLFPSEMLDSELGEIPKGWEVKSLDQIAHYQNGLALQKFRPENENDFLPVVKIAELKKGCADGEEKASPNIKPECIIDNGDVVFSWSGSLMVDIWCGGKAALNQHLFKVTSQSYPKWFFHQFTLHHLENFQRIAQAKAVTMGHIKREHLEQALCAVPSNHFIEAVNQYFEPTLNKAIECRLENNTLTTLRDSLLPKLLAGELLIDGVSE